TWGGLSHRECRALFTSDDGPQIPVPLRLGRHMVQEMDVALVRCGYVESRRTEQRVAGLLEHSRTIDHAEPQAATVDGRVHRRQDQARGVGLVVQDRLLRLLGARGGRWALTGVGVAVPPREVA